ncbi:MAG TPA: hypothetical protein VLL52_11220 [Anaerolineae bacterium]|nr:hypothetical protein [Anaerolineae bacterium]
MIVRYHLPQIRLFLPVFLLITTFYLTACVTSPSLPPITPPPLIREEPPSHSQATETAFAQAEPPPRDLTDLARRYRGLTNIPATAPATDYAVGDTAPFWYVNHNIEETVQTTARLAYRSEALNMWFETGARVKDADVAAAAQIIEQQILPTNRDFFGQEWQPGIDNDLRVNIFHLNEAGGNVAGYFSQADEFVAAVNPYSNQRELLYINLDAVDVGDDNYFDVIAHEAQHMIHWHVDANESIWMDEGLAELAAFLNGYGESDFVPLFTDLIDIQLNNFTYDGLEGGAHYGASFLFNAYFLDRFGDEMTRALVANTANGIPGIEDTLASHGHNISFDQLYMDWLVANYLDSHDQGFATYQYTNLDLPTIDPMATIDKFPAQDTRPVAQYGANYLLIEHNAPLELFFEGTRQVPILNTTAASGQYLWSTYPADNSNMSLTHPFDLTNLTTATLTFDTWYEIESGWDYAYVSVSTNNGQTWQPIQTVATTLYDPQGNSYGAGYSGVSGSGETPVWINETADLSPFTGQPILLRFEYVTDDAYHEQGFALDNIHIPELGFTDDVEAGPGQWQAAGFVRHTNVLPQKFALRLILISDEEVKVEELPLTADNNGRWSLPLNQTFNQAIIVVAGTTPVTTQIATYAYEVTIP